MSTTARKAPTTIFFIVFVTTLTMASVLPALAAEVPDFEITKLTAPDAVAGDSFGNAVAISGDTMVSGAYQDDDNGESSGSAYVYVRSGSGWALQAKLTASDATAGDMFGWSAAVSGDTVVIGAPDYGANADGSAAAYVFTRSGTTWTQQAKLTADDGQPWDHFGREVAVHEDTAIIAATVDHGGSWISGSAYVFTRSGTAWAQEAKLVAADGPLADYFASSVALSADMAVIGAIYDSEAANSAGAAYIFTRSGTTWTQQAKLMAGDATDGTDLGSAVAVSGNTVVIGAEGDAHNGRQSGAAYVFTGSGSNWTQQAKLLPSDGAVADIFGFAVAVSGDTAVIGSMFDDDRGSGSGSAYVFTRDGSIWTQETKLIPTDNAAGDFFGRSVAMSGHTAVIGAEGNDSGSGSAYVFGPDPTMRIASDTTLTDDHSGNVLITADNVTLDCAGHSITGSGHAGVELSARTGVTVANCDIHGFNHGIYVENSAANTLIGNTSTSAVYHGFSLWYSSGNTIKSNTGRDPGHHSFVTVDSDDNVFDGNTANGDGSTQGFHIVHGSDRNGIVNNTAVGNDIGFAIAIDGGHDNVLVGNTASGGRLGFLLDDGASDNVLAGNLAADNAQWGIAAWRATGNEFSGNSSTGNDYDGIHLGEGADGNTLSENVTADNGASGISTYRSDGNAFHSNTSTGNGESGLSVNESSSNMVIGNAATGNVGAGFSAYRADDNEFRDNTSTANAEWGLILNESSRNIVAGNDVTDSGQTGLVIWANPETTHPSNNNSLISNTVTGSTHEGVSVGGQATGNELVGNLVADNGGTGIHLGDGSVDTAISDNTATGNSEGISQYRATGSTITGNTLAHNTWSGISFGESHSNTVANNVSSENGDRGFALWQSDGNTLRDNVATNNEFDGFIVYEGSGNVLVGNTASGHDKDGSDGHYGFGFSLGYASDTTMEGNAAERNYHGIRLDFSDGNTLTQNAATMNVVGFDIVESNSNHLEGNVAEHNGDRAGFELRQGSSDNVLMANVARYTYQWAGFAVYDAFNNEFVENIAEHNKIGFGVWEPATGNTFTDNYARNAWLDAMDATAEGANTWQGNDFKWVDGDGGWR